MPLYVERIGEAEVLKLRRVKREFPGTPIEEKY